MKRNLLFLSVALLAFIGLINDCINYSKASFVLFLDSLEESKKKRELAFFFGSSLAFLPADRTTYKGSGARDDQCSCFDTAIRINSYFFLLVN